jgi:hypothetical protein
MTRPRRKRLRNVRGVLEGCERCARICQVRGRAGRPRRLASHHCPHGERCAQWHRTADMSQVYPRALPWARCAQCRAAKLAWVNAQNSTTYGARQLALFQSPTTAAGAVCANA